MRIVVFVDLDDTLFQTRPKCPEGEAVRPVAYRRDGAPLSYMTERQRILVEGLFGAATVIPTTARNLDAFRRVELPFEQIAILDFGGVVLLEGGAIDEAWDDRIRPQALKLAGELDAHRQNLERFSAEHDLGIHVRVIRDFDMPLYVVAKHPKGQGEQLRPIHKTLAASIDHERFFIHFNDNNLSLVPRFLGKERAVRYVIERHLRTEPVLTIGIGDSLTDAAFLELCDFSLIPQGSQLARHHFAIKRDS